MLPVTVLFLLCFMATIEATMEIEVDVESEEGITGTRRFTTKAYLTYVAIDADGRPIACPELLLETDDDKRRFEEASSKKFYVMVDESKISETYLSRKKLPVEIL